MSRTSSRIHIPIYPVEPPQGINRKITSFLLRQIALEPYLTGPLLLLLANRQRFLSPDNAITRNLRDLKIPIPNIQTTTKILRVLFTFGLLGRLNTFLNKWAQNGFQIKSLFGKKREESQWKFKPPNDNIETKEKKEEAEEEEKELIVITGGSSGFGYHMVEYFTKYTNSEIIILDITDPPSSLLDQNKNVNFYYLDLSIPSTSSDNKIIEVCNMIRKEHGHPTVLINNAGIANKDYLFSATLETDQSHIEHAEWISKIMHVNLISHFTLIRQLIPGMLLRGRGHVVTVASIASFASVGIGMADYMTTKAGVMALHECLTLELRNPKAISSHYKTDSTGPISNIKTTIIHPGWSKTGIIEEYEEELNKRKIFIMDPSTVASRIVKQIVEIQNSGQIILPDNMIWVTYLRSLPRWILELAVTLERFTTRRKR